MLTNFDLEDIANEYDLPLQAICMKDNLPKRVRDGNYIINLQSSEGGKNHGTHWTALVVKGKQSLFFDPFGVWPSTDIRDFVRKRKGSHLAFTIREVQDIHSNNCGLFCLGFLIMTHRNKNSLWEGANAFLEMFSPDTRKNDRIIKNLLPHSHCGCDGRR